MNPAEMQAAVLRGLKEKTGRELDEWIELLRAEGLATRKERVAWLKSVHGLGHVTATIVADHEAGTAHAQLDPQALIDQLFARESEALRALLADVLAFARGLGDVAVVPCKGYVGLKSRRQFAAIRPKGGRLEIGLALMAAPNEGTHAVRGLGGGSLTVGVWADESWRSLLEQAHRESLEKA